MKIFVLCGPIASGKSTYCKNAARNGVIVMNDDSIVNLLHADDYTLYDEKLKPFYKSIENHIVSLSVAMNKSIVIDRGLNISLKGRKRWIALAGSFDVPCEAISFVNEGPEIHAQRRVSSDSRGRDYDYWLKVAKAHQSRYSSPTLDEGFSDLHDVTFDDIKKGFVVL